MTPKPDTDKQTRDDSGLSCADLFALSVKVLAARINDYLKKWESDPNINVGLGTRGLRKYYNAWAYPSGRWVNVIYISYQGKSSLTKEQAAIYLDALDKGYIGSHHGVISANVQGHAPTGDDSNQTNTKQ